MQSNVQSDRPNRLAEETSPYLRQHAANPVDWYPWGEAALAAARAADKPILLSIGYSACHWCHVMAHESFEDTETAELMNELFVNVKVDREERPDLDRIYQLAQQLLTRQTGGWPLTMFLTPEDQTPFFGGTYFPKQARRGMPAFAEVLHRVAQYFRESRDEIRRQNAQLSEILAGLTPPSDRALILDDGPLAQIRQDLERALDPEFGGFGQAPKFPHPTSIERCLRAWHRTAASARPDRESLFMATLTLTRMAEGGIFDQLGGGFFRYCVDRRWMIPHFEKMLYDNAALLALYSQAHLATGEGLFAATARATAGWVLREMRAPEGAFYSSLDADSEGTEGKFYVWDAAAVRTLLPEAQFAAFAERFGLTGGPNFEAHWHLHVRESAVPAGPAAALIDSARATLLAQRERRVRPNRDTKILTSWNGLLIKGLGIAARCFDDQELAQAASGAVEFIRANLWTGGRLLACSTDGRAHLPAYLDDYAFLADGLLELLQVRWRTSDLEFLTELAEVLLSHFEDQDHHGFFFTASDHEPLFYRSKSFTDEALPCANAIAASVLCKLGYLLGETRYLDAAERTLRAAWSVMREHPLAAAGMVNALEDFLESTTIVVVRGRPEETRVWTRALARVYAPRRLVFGIDSQAGGLPPALAAKSAGRATTAYLCTGMTCSAPFSDLEELAQALRQSAA